MRKHGGWFEKDGTPHMTAWFAKQQAKRKKHRKVAKAARKRNRHA